MVSSRNSEKKLVAQVVMGGDVAAASRRSIPPQPVGNPGQRAENTCRAAFHAGRHRGIPAEDPHQADQVVAGPVSADIRLRRAETAAENQMSIEARVADLDRWPPESPRPTVRIPDARRRHQSPVGHGRVSPSGATPSGVARGRGNSCSAWIARRYAREPSVMVAAPPIPGCALDGDRTGISSATVETPASRWPGSPAPSSRDGGPTREAWTSDSTPDASRPG